MICMCLVLIMGAGGGGSTGMCDTTQPQSYVILSLHLVLCHM